MCITFIYNGSQDDSCQYALILISNRDEAYSRLSSYAHVWHEDGSVIGGRDLQAGDGEGTWLALSPTRTKLGLLLNLPGQRQETAKRCITSGRGHIVSEYVKTDSTITEYAKTLSKDTMDTNDFVLVAVEFGNLNIKIHTFNNENGELQSWDNVCEGFSNSLPDKPLKKVREGKAIFEKICRESANADKKIFIDELVTFLKNSEKHLPDDEIEARSPGMSVPLSSIYVSMPEYSYGTRCHNIVLLSKTGQLDFVELSMQAPTNPEWKRAEFSFELAT